jgi:hypothetical protein
MHASHEHVADEVSPPGDHLGIRWALFWLVVGSAMVGTAIVAFGWKRTLEVWAISGVVLALLFVGERLWYKYIRKSE